MSATSLPNAVITLTGDGLKKALPAALHISVIATVNVDAASARRQASIWLANETGTQPGPGDPRLIIGERTVWRMPVLLTSSIHGIVGEVGSIDVDAGTGELLAGDALRDEILSNVQRFGRPAPTTD